MNLYSHIISLINNTVEALRKRLCLCKPVVSVIALSTNVCDGSSVNLTSRVDQRVSNYQWQSFDGTSWVNISGATNHTYSEVLTVGEYTYRLIVGYGTPCYGISSPVTVLGVENTLLTYDSADDNEFCAGGIANMHSETILGTPPYYVQLQHLIGSEWIDVGAVRQISSGTGADENYYSEVLADVGNYEYRFVVTDSAGCVAVSDGEIIVVNADPTVVATSEDYDICNGGITVLHSEVTGGAGDNSYQWQVLISGVWTNILGANGADYITDALSTNTYEYRVIVTQDIGCAAMSNSVMISVVPDPTFSIGVTPQLVCEGYEFFMGATTVIGGSGLPTYQWQYESAPDVWDDIFGANSDFFTVNAGTFPGFPLGVGDYTFRLLVIQDSGCETYSNELVVTIQDQPTVSIAADDTTIGVGGSATITVTPSGEVPGDPITYLMEYWDGGSWVPMPVSDPFGFFYASIPDIYIGDMEPITGVAGPLQAGSYDFRVSMTQGYGCASVPSNTVTITVS